MSVDIDMMDRERPALEEPDNRKKAKLHNDGGSEPELKWTGWYTMSFLVQRMGQEFGDMVDQDKSIPRKWSGPWTHKPAILQFLITDKIITAWYKKKNLCVYPRPDDW